jgi:AraC-like DNA-binding protein
MDPPPDPPLRFPTPRGPFLNVETTSIGGAPPTGTLDLSVIGPIRFAAASGRPMTVDRREQHIAASGEDVIQLLFLDAGRAVVRQEGREAHLEVGDFTLLDVGRPFTVRFPQHFTTRVFEFPRAGLGIAERDLARLTATALRQDHALSAFLIPFLRQLSAQSAALHPQTREHLAHNVTAILATLILDHLQDAPLPDPARRTLVLRVKSFIMNNLALPELSPQLIAVEHNISVRYLHKLFASESTTLSRWILRARLERCHRDLSIVDLRTVSVAGVARQWGFSSPARFSRVFRETYGLSPRQWQAESVARRAADGAR